MRKLAFRYRRLKEIYNSYKGNVGGKFTSAGSYFLTAGVKNKFVFTASHNQMFYSSRFHIYVSK